MLSCPLCHSNNCTPYFQDTVRDYSHCLRCDLVFVPPEFHLSLADEKAIYDLHENDATDLGYRSFLSRLIAPLEPYLPNCRYGLDYGCGPSPVLASMLKEKGLSMQTYDPFYAPSTDLFVTKYDLITCTEAIEHFFSPATEWDAWLKMLNPQGLLAIMTKRVLNKARFINWHYKNDLTHVCFFSEATFKWLALTYGFEVMFPANDIVLLKKQK